MDTAQEILADAKQRMEGAVDKLGGDFATIRTGRANPGLLHRITVDYYGTRTPLLQLANCAVPEPRMLLVNPYDKSALNDIEKAIREADLGLNPANDGDVIRCVFPELTKDERERHEKQIDELTSTEVAKVDQQLKGKEAELEVI